jgi:DNA-binding beta-propeller fold protein YncE
MSKLVLPSTLSEFVRTIRCRAIDPAICRWLKLPDPQSRGPGLTSLQAPERRRFGGWFFAMLGVCGALLACAPQPGVSVCNIKARTGPQGKSATILVGPNQAFPGPMAFDGLCNIYMSVGQTVVRIDPSSHALSRVAGDGSTGFNGDNLPAGNASLYNPAGLAVGPDGALYIMDTWNERIRRVDPQTGIISTIAGNGGTGVSGDGGPARDAALALKGAEGPLIAVDATSGVFFADDSDVQFLIRPPVRIRHIDSQTGMISTVAGTGERGPDIEGKPATSTRFAGIRAIKVDDHENLYVLDGTTLKRVDHQTGRVSTLVSPPSDGICRPADINSVSASGIAFQPDRGLYLRDSCGGRIFSIDPGTLSQKVVAALESHNASGLWVDAAGSLYAPTDFRDRTLMVKTPASDQWQTLMRVGPLGAIEMQS